MSERDDRLAGGGGQGDLDGGAAGPQSAIRQTLVAAVVASTVLWATAASAVALPDGRAYELVSPPDKGGYEVSNPSVPGDPRAQAALTGDEVTYVSAGVFPDTGAQSASTGVTYLSKRPSGDQGFWLTSVITAPLPNPALSGTLSSGGVRDLSDDLSLALMDIEGVLPGDPPQPPERFPLYLRDNLAASFELLTPALVPFPAGVRQEFRVPFQASDDFEHVVWEGTHAEVAGDTLPDGQRRVYESFVNAQGEREVRLASILPDGQTSATVGGAGAASTQNFVSADGDRIFFGVSSNDIYVRENGTTTTFIANGGFRGAARDGSKVFVTDGAGTLHRYDVPAGTSTVVGTGVRVGASAGGVLGYSDDASRVYFASVDQLGTVPVPAGMKLYLWEDGPGGGTTTFVAPLSDSQDPVFLDDRDNWDDFFNSRLSRVTPDGEHLLFLSSAQVTAFDNQGTRQAYLYEAGGSVECVSCPSTAPVGGSTAGGFPRGFKEGDASLNVPTVGTGIDEQPQNLTDDGRRVFFQSPAPLVPEDGNGRVDVYEYDAGTKQVALISSGQSSSPSTFADASPEGDDVFFATREPLVGWDKDALYDVYDARVGGGLPEPPTLPPACSGDECQGQPSSGPALAGPSTSLLRGLGDLVPGRRPAFRLRRPSRAELARFAKRGKLTLPVRVNRAGRVSASAKAKLSERARTVAKGSKRTKKAGIVKLTLRLSKAVRRVLARGRALRVSVAVRFTGVREAKRLVLNLRRPNSRSAQQRSASVSRRAAAPAGRKAR